MVATASGFSPATSEPVYVGAGARVTVDVTLQVGPLQQAVVVTAAAAELLQSQTGAPVTVIDSTIIAAQNKPDLQEALRLVPGAQVQQTGARGGQSSIFVRGGNSNFTKVLVDGVSVNDIGGGFDFSQIQTTGVDRIEVMRQSNSVVYGSDALTGVINVETRRGRTRIPDVAYTVDGGNLGTFRTNASIGGAVKRVDYFSEYSYFTTDNKRAQQRLPQRHLRRPVRRDARHQHRPERHAARTSTASSAAPTASRSTASPTIPPPTPSCSTAACGPSRSGPTACRPRSATARSGQTSSLQQPDPHRPGRSIRSASAPTTWDRRSRCAAPRDGRSRDKPSWTTAAPIPQPFESRTTRRTLFGQTTYRVTGDLHISGGGRFEQEAGYSDPDGDPDQTRNNGGVFVEGRGSIGGRTHISAGVGVEHNAAFETATTPRLSIASYLRNPARGAVGDTKLVLNFGKGIKAMSVFQQQSSLFALLESVPAAPAGGSAGPGAQHQLRRRRRTGLCRWPGARARVLLPQLVRGPD